MLRRCASPVGCMKLRVLPSSERRKKALGELRKKSFTAWTGGAEAATAGGVVWPSAGATPHAATANAAASCAALRTIVMNASLNEEARMMPPSRLSRQGASYNRCHFFEAADTR